MAQRRLNAWLKTNALTLSEAAVAFERAEIMRRCVKSFVISTLDASTPQRLDATSTQRCTASTNNLT